MERGGRREGLRSKGTRTEGISRMDGMGWEARRVKIQRDMDGRYFEEGRNGVEARRVKI